MRVGQATAAKLLGGEPISIGLYAGGDATPNGLDDAKA